MKEQIINEQANWLVDYLALEEPKMDRESLRTMVKSWLGMVVAQCELEASHEKIKKLIK